MRLCNADVDEAERNPAEFEDFDEPEDEDGGDGGVDGRDWTSIIRSLGRERWLRWFLTSNRKLYILGCLNGHIMGISLHWEYTY